MTTIQIPPCPEGMIPVGGFTTPIEMGACAKLLGAFSKAYPDARVLPTNVGWTFIIGPGKAKEKAEISLQAIGVPEGEVDQEYEMADAEDELIEERDHWEELATTLANLVGEKFGFDVGEHSSANCPVQNAIDYLKP